MTKLILSTGNIVSGGPSIIRKPGTYRSNLELTNSLRSNFLAAQDYYAAVAQTNGNGNGNGNNGNHGAGSATTEDGRGLVGSGGARRQPASVWTARVRERTREPAAVNGVGATAGADDSHGPGADNDGGDDDDDDVMYIPRIDWDAAAGHLQEEATRYDITAKLFFLPTAPSDASHRRRYARAALSLVLRELGVPAVDLLIISMPGMSFEGDCEYEADRANASQGDDDEEAATWAATAEELHGQGLVRRLGVAEFGSDKLARLLRRVSVRPAVDQINVKNCCNVPPPLVRLAREQDIELLVHSDCTDILPRGILRELLGQGLQGAGILAGATGEDDDDFDLEEAPPSSSSAPGLQGDLTPQWVIKYTAVVRDRGVIENKGYFAGAELKET